MKNKIVKFLKEFLGILELEAKQKATTTILLDLSSKNKELLRENQKLSKEVKFLQEHIKVGVDINNRFGSWAVIALQGKKNDFISFIDLGDKDLREIQGYLRQYERRSGGGIRMDMPFGLSKKTFWNY